MFALAACLIKLSSILGLIAAFHPCLRCINICGPEAWLQDDSKTWILRDVNLLPQWRDWSDSLSRGSIQPESHCVGGKQTGCGELVHQVPAAIRPQQIAALPSTQTLAGQRRWAIQGGKVIRSKPEKGVCLRCLHYCFYVFCFQIYQSKNV